VKEIEMRRKLFILALLALPLVGMAQTSFTDCPTLMQNDNLSSSTRVTRDFAFNADNDLTISTKLVGPTDLNIRYWTTSGTATITIEVYGIMRKAYLDGDGITTLFTLSYQDSARVGTLAATTTPQFKRFAIDPLYTAWGVFDGVQIVLKRLISAGPVLTQSNIRIEN
jgi:hypothetical protein